jgi:hypothetical protein
MAFVPAACPEASAVITSNPLLPPDTGVYFSHQFPPLEYTASELQVLATEIVLDPFAETAERNLLGLDELEVFDATFTAGLSINIGGSLFIEGVGELAGPVSTITLAKADLTTGTFLAEIVEMSLSGEFGGVSLMVRESPTLPSSGITSITDLGGGLYNIDSFFDVFTELSVDGGETWMPANESTRMFLVVPEPATIVIFGLGAFLMSKKRKP